MEGEGPVGGGQINGTKSAVRINETRSYHVICHAICLSFEIVSVTPKE